MYELTKQKSRGYMIVFGIIIFAFVTAVLKMAFREPKTSINDDLIKVANEINSHAPIIIDSTTRLDNVNALSGGIFQYNYTLLTMDKEAVDVNLLKTSSKESMIKQMKQNPNLAVLKDNNIDIQLKYRDKNGDDVASVYISANEY